MFLNSIIGHSAAKALLRRAFELGRLAHGYLFAGPEGVGKMTFALALAKFLLCKTHVDDDACGRCASCRRTAARSHPDLHLLEIDASKQGIVVEQVEQELLRPVWLKSYEGGWRCFLIDGAHTLRSEVANRLLKVLEEPPENTLLVLVSHQPSQVLPTLLSRCARVNFAPLSRDDVRIELAGRTKLEAVELETLVRYSRGRLGYGLKLTKDAFFRARGEFFRSFVDSPTQRNFDVAAELIAVCTKGNPSKPDQRRELIAAMGVISRFFADAMALQTGVAEEFLTNVDQVELVRKANERFSSRALHDIIERIQEAAAFLAANVHMELTVASLVSDILCLRARVIEPEPAYKRYLRNYA